LAAGVVCCATHKEASPVKDYVGAIDQGTTSTRFMVFDKSAALWRWRRKSMNRFFRGPDGSSMTRWRSCAARKKSSRRLSPSAACAPQTSPPSASPTRGRRPSSGSGIPGSRSPMPSSGKTRGGRRCGAVFTGRRAGPLPPADRAAAQHYFSSLKLRWLLQNIPKRKREPLRASCFLEIWIRSSSGT